MKKLLLFLLFISGALFLQGCLVSEVEQYRLSLNEDGVTWTLSITRRNIESDSHDSATQRQDFLELISNWKLDRYLLSQVDRGRYVKSRRLSLEHGKLVWRETVIVSDVNKFLPGINLKEEVRFPLQDTTGLSITTNGLIVSEKDSIVILWPPHTRIFEVKSVRRDYRGSSRFHQRFQSYMKNR